MADSRTKIDLKENFIQALSALMAADPNWGLSAAIQIVAQAQQLQRDWAEYDSDARLVS